MNYKIKIFKQTDEQGTFFIAYFNTSSMIGLARLNDNIGETEEQAIARLKEELFDDTLVGEKLDKKHNEGLRLVDVIALS
jgi:hypothetical protein